jgi:hypothetical protein
MTFQTAAYAVDGNSESGNFLRLMLQSATNGAQGVIGATDCQVLPTTPTPTAGIVITSGAALVAGAETPFQGSYFGYNVGNDTTLSIAATGGSARSDMIVVRAEDPTWSGSPWGGSPAAQILFPRVISGVSSSATVPPGGISAIPLARIDVPASTSAITAAMIHDLRQVSNPQRIMSMLAVAGSGSNSWGITTTAIQWPTGASWTVPIPSWATQMVVMWAVNELTYHQVGGALKGWVWPVIGSSVTAPVVATPQTLVNMNSSSGPGRHSISGGGSVAIPASIRGTNQTLQFAQVGDGTTTDILTWESGGTATLIYEFQQLASAA